MSDLIKKAIEVATEAHMGQTRKDGTPFISHPLKVAEYVESYYGKHEAYTDDVKIAAILHDTIEDSPDKISPEKISELFGSKVLSYVNYLTRKSHQTKMAYYDNLGMCAPAQVIWIKLCDRLSNLEDTYKLDMSSPKNALFASYYVRDTTNLLDAVGTVVEDTTLIALMLNTINMILSKLYYPT